MPIRVVPHNPCWATQFALEAKRVRKALGANVVAIHHIGSTAIPTIYAKPIIDMLVEVAALQRVDEDTSAMVALGYEGLGAFGIPGRRYFRKDNDAGIRVYHVHVFARESPQVERHLAFRDFMIYHPNWAEQYSALKQTLAAAHRDDREAYMDGKDAFIKEMDRKAAAWRAGA